MGNNIGSMKHGEISGDGNSRTGKIIIKFNDDFKVPYEEKTGDYLEKINFKPWTSLKKEHPEITIQPLFTKSEQESLKRLVKRAEKLNPRFKDPHFFSCFCITIPKSSDPDPVLKLMKGWKELKTSYLEPVAVCPNPLDTYSTNGRAVNQGYLDAAPKGIGSKSVWGPTTVAGSDGAGIKFVDLETGWNLSHEDLSAHAISLLDTNATPSARPHGTSVLGIVCASDNDKGCIGVAPNPGSIKVISPTDTSLAGAIGTAADDLGYGDILLIEQTYMHHIGSTDFYVPVEVISTTADVIFTATSAGVIVVEPGGDGDLAISAINFLTYQNPVDLFDVLNPASLNYVDTGAIIVSASKSAESTLVPGTHEKADWAPFGARVDCYAWGENINTLDTDSAGSTNTAYRTDFGFSSGAAAIIAGAVLSIQGMVKAKTNLRLSPAAMRSLLRNSAYGTNLLATGTSTPLGIYMPNLALINSGYLPPLPVFSVVMSETDPSPAGTSTGSATATPFNGTSPYTYTWNTTPPQNTQTAAGLSSGIYTVIVTDKNGCSVSGSIAVGDITATVDSTEITCNGAGNGTITISGVTGGTAPYTYSIDNGVTWSASNIFTGLGPGTYYVQVKDNTGLIKPLGTVVFVDPDALSATVTYVFSSAWGAHDGSISISSPFGGSGTYQYSDNGGTSWQSSGDFTGLGPGTYNVQMRDAMNVGCVKVLNPSLVIMEPGPAFVVNATVTDIVKFGDSTGAISLMVAGGHPPYTFLWSNGATTQNITALKAGLYSVRVDDSGGGSVTNSWKVRHIYCDILRNNHHGILIKLLKITGYTITGYRVYKIMWRGYPPFHPPFLHPHVDVLLNNITLGPILSESVGGVTWNYRALKVPVSYEGDIAVLPSPVPLPVFPRSLTVPVKLLYYSRSLLPFGRPPVLIADFKILIGNNNVDYTI
jgi:hypothetical protein